MIWHNGGQPVGGMGQSTQTAYRVRRLYRLCLRIERGNIVKSFFCALALVLLCDLSAAAAGTTGPIVDTAFVADAAKRSAIIWDVRSAQEYAKGHLPGAVNIDDAARVLRDANTEDFIAIDKIEKIPGAAGIDPAREMVIYGNRGAWNPYFGLYTMQYFGGTRATVYYGGIEEWRAAGNAISTEANKLPAV